MSYYFLCDYQSNTKIFFGEFHENVPNLSQEMEKYALPPPPPPLPRQKKYKTQNSPKQSEITPIKRFSLATIRVSSRICNVGVCRKFYKKPNGSQEIEKNTLKESKNTLRWPPGKEDLL